MKKSLVVALMALILFGGAWGDEKAIATAGDAPEITLEAMLKTLEEEEEEIASLRAEHRRSFRKADGRQVTVISTEPLNYFDDDQQYYPIETQLTATSAAPSKTTTAQTPGAKSRTLAKAARSPYAFVAEKNAIKARFAETSTGGAEFEYKNQAIHFTLDHSRSSRGRIDGNKIRYPKVLEDADLQYTILPGKVKDELIFERAPKSPVITFRVSLNDLTPRSGKGGTIDLVGPDGEAVFTILPSIMYEQDDQERFKILETKFHRDGDQLYCDLLLDLGWLKRKGRKYPVVVDPQIVPFDSSGKTEVRFRLHAPESYSNIAWEARVSGPEYHGHLGSHTKARFQARDLTSGQVYANYSGLHDYYSNASQSLSAGHDYEVYIRGGKAKNIMGSSYTGSAWAVVTYGDDNLRLFQTVPQRRFNMTVGSTLEKVFALSTPQTVAYDYQMEVTSPGMSSPPLPYFRIYYEGSSTPLYDLQTGTGKIQLNPGTYRVVLSPGWNHFRARLDFPRSTANYERWIDLRTDPGRIESVLMLPADSEMLLQYQTKRSGSPSSQAYPTVQITTDEAAIFQRSYDLGYYNFFDGGDKVSLVKDRRYHVIVSRGRNGSNGWGQVNLDVYHVANQIPSTSGLGLVNAAGQAVTSGYGGNGDRFQFEYADPDQNTLKAYTLKLNQTTPALEKEWVFEDQQLEPGTVTIPHALKDLGLSDGATVAGRVTIWDGYDTVQMLQDFLFIVDNTPPEIETFQGEVDRTDNGLQLTVKDRDDLSGVARRELIWRVNGQAGGAAVLGETDETYRVSGLPANARVETTYRVTDRVGNVAEKVLIFYTYPEPVRLVAPTIAANRERALLKMSKSEASYIRVERYRDRVSEATKDYDTGYLDTTSLALGSAGAPRVSLIGPVAGAVYNQPADIYLSADAYDVDGRIVKVTFKANDTVIGSVNRSPYNLTWKNATAGEYRITAVALDDDGQETVSEAAAITITNQPATVVITSPKEGTSLSPPAALTFSADAFDSDGTVVRVDFYANNVLLGSVAEPPYRVALDDIPAGIYNLVAKATDNNGAESVSNPVTLRVVPPAIGPYAFTFNCDRGSSGVNNLFRLYLPAAQPAGGSYTYERIGSGQTRWLNSDSNLKTVPCLIRVKYTVGVGDRWDKNKATPYFRVTLNDGQVLVNQEFYNATRSGEFYIPAGGHILIDMHSGKRANEHRIHSDDNYGYYCWYSLSFEYVLDTPNLSRKAATKNLMRTMAATAVTGSVPDASQYYLLPEPEPAKSHESYIYRIYSKNGDKEVYQDSGPVPVANGIPEIRALDPEAGSRSYSNGSFGIELAEVYDDDGDELRYEYTLEGLPGSGSTASTRYQWTNLPDGTYRWTATVRDNYAGETRVSGEVIVDKTLPLVGFRINDLNAYTNSSRVRLSLDNVGEQIAEIRVSNDGNAWTVLDDRRGIDWDLDGGDGRKTVYLQSRNLAGTWGPVLERSIILDQTPPDGSHFSVKPQGREGAVYFRWAGARDGLSGIAGYEVETWDGDAWRRRATEPLADSTVVAAAGYNRPVRLRVRALDQAGNAGEWLEALGYTKAAAGAVDLETSWSGYSPEEGHFIQLQLIPAEGADQYKIICTEDPGGGATVLLDADAAEAGYRNTSLVKHGVYGYKVYSFNSAGEVTENPEIFTLAIVNQPPQVPEALAPAGFINRGDNVALTFDRPLEGLDPDQDPLTISYFLSEDGLAYNPIPLPILDGLVDGGSYWWYARIDDGYGGVVQTEPVRFGVDLNPPVISVDHLAVGYAASHRVQARIVENGSGVRRITINGQDVEALPEIFEFTAQGANPLRIEVSDRAGNTASFSHLYYVDRTPPELGKISFDLDQNGGIYRAGEAAVPVRWEGVDPETGIRQFKYAWSEGSSGFEPSALKTVAVLGGLDEYQTVLSGDFEDGHTYYLHLAAENYLGLQSGWAVSPALFYDHTAPVLELKGLGGGHAYGGYYYLSDLAKLRADYMAEDPHSGVARVEFALAEAVDQEELEWQENIDALKAGGPTPGKSYYLGVRATNGTGLATVVFSPPLILDATPPELTVTAVVEQADDRHYLARVRAVDPESIIRRMDYAIGTTPGGSDLSARLPGASADGWLGLAIAAEVELSQPAEIPIGTVYYITVRAENAAGLVRTASSAAVTVIGGDAPVVRDQGRYSADPGRLQFEWHLPGDPTVAGYQYQIRDGAGVVREWTDSEAPSVLAEGLALVHGGRYFADVRAILGDGSYSPVGASDGITIDLTPPKIKAFYPPAYSDGDGVALTWEAEDPESGIRCYGGISAQPGGSDLTGGWIYLGELGYFTITHTTAGTPLDLAHGGSYYLTLWVENGAGTVVQQIGAAFTVDRTPPPAPVVIDEGNFTNRPDQLKFSWKWPLGDEESGVREYWYALTREPAVSGGEIWYTSQIEREALLDELELEQGGSYYLAVKAINGAGLSSIGFSDGIVVDTTGPALPQVVDYGDFSIRGDMLEVAVVASDAESGIAGYRLDLGTAVDPGAVFKDRAVLSGGGLEVLRFDGLHLTEGEVYYFTVSALNQAGLESLVSTSDGIMVDSGTPEITAVTVDSPFLTDPDRLTFTWQATATPSGIAGVQYAVSTDPAGNDLAWQTTGLGGSQTLTGLNLEENRVYYVFVRVQSRAAAENDPTRWSQPGRSGPVTLDLTPPEIRLDLPGNGLVGTAFPLRWEALETTSGITEHRYAIGASPGSTELTGGWISIVTTAKSIDMVLNDLPLVNGKVYYLSVMAKNGAGQWSTMTKSRGLTAELTPPEVTRLEYGANYLRSLTIISGIGWSAVDEESGIAAYRAALVTETDGRELTGAEVAVSQGEGSITLDQLGLRDGGIYYIALQVKNGVGSWSVVAYSHPIRVDVTLPEIRWADDQPEVVTVDGELDIPWFASEAGTVRVKLEYPLGRIEESETGMALENIYGFRQTERGVYTLTLTPVDLAGNEGPTALRIIRFNRLPVANPGPDRTVFKGSAVHFTAEAYDADGVILAYEWDFGNGVTSIEAEPRVVYGQTGIYQVSLRVQDNDGQWSEPAVTTVTVTNSTWGELETDETWEGEIEITGDIIVPKSVVLTVRAGARIYFGGNYGIKVYGQILIEGTAEKPVTVAAAGAWSGIRLEHSEAVSVIRHVALENATVGVAVLDGEAELSNCRFSGNRIGIHVIAASPRIEGCEVTANTLYGIKEDDGAGPVVTGCLIRDNGVADYYEDGLGIITIQQLNQLSGNERNQ